MDASDIDQVRTASGELDFALESARRSAAKLMQGVSSLFSDIAASNTGSIVARASAEARSTSRELQAAYARASRAREAYIKALGNHVPFQLTVGFVDTLKAIGWEALASGFKDGASNATADSSKFNVIIPLTYGGVGVV